MDRFDLDNLNTAATRALAEQEPHLEAAMSRRYDQAKAQGEAMTVAMLRKEIDPSKWNMQTSKEDLVICYIERAVYATVYAKEREVLRADARADRRLAQLLNEMLDRAESARVETPAKVAEAHASARVSVLRNGIVDEYAGVIAARILAAVEDGHDLREVVVGEYAHAIKLALNYVGTSLADFCNAGLRDEEEIIAANRFRQEVARRLPDIRISMDRFVF